MRLDSLLAIKENISRTKAKQLIEDGRVSVNGKVETKAALDVKESDDVILSENFKFVSLGGDKLEKALYDFNFSVDNMVCIDVGASNGGFTDCLLKRNAAKVYAIDVGECCLEKSVLADNRVVVMDKTNARELNPNMFDTIIDFCCVDCSFISLKLLFQPIYNVLKQGGVCMALIKPQFECGRKALSKNGIVLKEKDRKYAIEDLSDFAKQIGFRVDGVTTAPIKKDKNIEYVIMLTKI